MSDPRPVLDELREDYGPVVGLGAGPMHLAIVGDPIALQDLFRTPVDSFSWGHRFNVLGFVVGRDSLIVSDGREWERRRSSVRTGLTRRRVLGWTETIVERTDAHIDVLLAPVGAGGERVVDLYEFGRTLVQEIVMRVMFGERLASRADEIANLFQSAQDYLESPFLRQLPHPLPFGRRANVRADLRALRAIIEHELSLVRADPSGDPLDVLETLAVEGALSDSEICDQTLTLMGAGMDTTSATLAWMLWCCALANRDLWTRLRAEADEILSDDNSSFDATHPARLDLAERTVRETTASPPRRLVLSPYDERRRDGRRLPHPKGNARSVVGPPCRPGPGGVA